MKAVILAGGLGSRLSEETTVRPKPMVEIGGQPILWHIMKFYSHYGVNDFVICLGYKGYLIKEYFANYLLHVSDITVDFITGERTIHQNNAEPWRVTLIDTGAESMTGGRLRRAKNHIGDETFCMTYGDGVSDVDLPQLIALHRNHGRLATLTAVRPPGRFGVVELDEDKIIRFHEKPDGGTGWINGGFFVLEPAAIDFIDGDATHWEREPLEALARQSDLHAFKHEGFWQPMDTLRDKVLLEKLWADGCAPWKVWE